MEYMAAIHPSISRIVVPIGRTGQKTHTHDNAIAGGMDDLLLQSQEVPTNALCPAYKSSPSTITITFIIHPPSGACPRDLSQPIASSGPHRDGTMAAWPTESRGRGRQDSYLTIKQVVYPSHALQLWERPSEDLAWAVSLPQSFLRYKCRAWSMHNLRRREEEEGEEEERGLRFTWEVGVEVPSVGSKRR